MAEVRKIGATDLSYKDFTSPAGKIVKGVEPVDVREFGATPDAGAAVDQWSYFDTAIKYCNDNYKALYVPPGRYYVSAALDLSSGDTVRGYYSFTMFSDIYDFQDLNAGAVISPHSTFVGGASTSSPTNLLIINKGRGVTIRGISFVGNYHADGKYISAIGIKNQNNQTRLQNINIYDFYIGVSVAYGGDSNNDLNTFDRLIIAQVEYGIVNSGSQTYGSIVSNSAITADSVCFDDSQLLGLTKGGNWSFYNVLFSFGTASGPVSYGIKSTSGGQILSVWKCHFEPEDQPYMPYYIYAGATASGSIDILDTYFNYGGLTSSDDSASYPSFYFRSPNIKISNCTFSGSKNIIMDVNPWSANGRLVFQSSSIHLSGAGKTFTAPEYATFMNTTYLNDADGLYKIYNDYGLYSRVYSESRQIGWGDYTTGWPAQNNPASSYWDDGSIILKSTPAETGAAIQFGWHKISGTLTPTYVTTAPIMTLAPSASGDTGVAGSLAWDASYLYVCTGTNYWKRVALSAY